MPWDSLGSHSQWHSLDFPGPHDMCRSASHLYNMIRIDLKEERTYLAHFFPPRFPSVVHCVGWVNDKADHRDGALGIGRVSHHGDEEAERKRWMTLVTHFSFTGPYLLQQHHQLG